MGFVGRLEDLTLTDIFQVLSHSKRSGRLLLTRRKQQGLIVFHNGGIIYCQSNTARETLGSILVNRKIITESTLLAAVDRQQIEEDKPLGQILVEMNAVSKENLEEVIREQVKDVLSELISWTNGVFQFEPLELPNSLRAAVSANEFIIERGLSTEQIVLELLTSIDEEKIDGSNKKTDQEERDPIKELFADFGATQGQKENMPVVVTRGFASLKSIMTELRSYQTTFTGEVSLMLLRYAAEIVNRSVLFALRGDHFSGIGQFGITIEGENPDRRIRNIKIPLGEASVLNEVCESMEPYRGRVVNNHWNRNLMKELGGQFPREAVAIPVIVDGASVAVIYGDNLPEDTLIGPTEGLELLMIEAGLVIEKSRLEMKLREQSRDKG